MNTPYKQNVADWMTVRLEDSTGNPLTGILRTDGLLSAAIAKVGGAQAAKALGVGEWVEIADGEYWVKMLAADVDTLGAGLLKVKYNGVTFSYPFRVFVNDVDTLRTAIDAILANTVLLLGLSEHQVYKDLLVYDVTTPTDLVSARIRQYDTQANALAHGATGLLNTWSAVYTYSAPGILATVSVTK
jgi:hypothetical protein